MSHKKRRQTVPRKRRLPRPSTGPPPGPALPPDPADLDQPVVVEIAARIERLAALTGLSALTILTDWTGMFEASLRFYADNARAYARTGRFVEDPPEVQAIFRRARERYLRATERAPAAYREMQTAFALACGLLIEVAGAGLNGRARSPAIIDLVFQRCVRPGPDWWPFLTPWEQAMEIAAVRFPRPDELVYEALIEAHLRYRTAAADPLRPEPGPLFEQWFAEVLPFCAVTLPPETVGCSPLLLATATRFPTWAVANNIVRFPFRTEGLHPLPARMLAINARLHGLNGYSQELIQAALDIVTIYEQQPAPPETNDPSPPVQPPRPLPDQATFTALFRRSDP